MGFGIQFSTFDNTEISRKIYYAILDAEKNGENVVKFVTKGFISSSLEVGQIIHYKDDDEKSFENHWKVAEILDTRKWEEMEGGGRVTTGNGEEIIVFEKIENYVFDVVGKKATYEDVVEVTEQIKEMGFNVGGFIITSSGILGKIETIKTVEITDDDLTYRNPKNNPNRITVKSEVIRIIIKLESTGLRRYDLCGEFVHEETITVEELFKTYNPIKWLDYNQIKEKMENLMLGVEIDDQILIGNNPDVDENKDNALVGFGDNKHLKILVKNNEKNIKLTLAVISLDKRGIHMQKEELDRKMGEIKSKSEEMLSLMKLNITEMNTKVRNMYRLIDTIEIFTGVSEKIIQIKEGEDSKEEVINLFQKKLFMDEEVGIWENGGIDFKNIAEFDAWVVNDISKLIPYETGIVIVQPRRNNKRDYREKEFNVFSEAMKEEANSRIYILIRNGSNIYRIWSDKIPHHKRLFPLQDEFQNIVDKVSKTEMKMKNDDSYYDSVVSGKQTEDNKDEIFFYTRNFLLIQGLINRTNIFKFIPADFNIMDVSNHGDMINYVYNDDDSTAIGDGFPSFNDFVTSINAGLKRGKKIIMFPTGYNSDIYDTSRRYNVDWGHDKKIYPPDGTFTVKSEIVKTKHQKKHYITEREYLDNKKKYYKLWHGSDEIRDGVKYVQVEKINCEEDIYFEENEEHYITFFQSDRYEKFYKQWIRFRIKKTDRFFICYEDIDDKILDYYMNDREARRHYLLVLPLFSSFKEEKRKDAEIEKYYVDMMLSKISDINIPIASKIKAIDKAIDFWKFGGKTFVNTFSTIKRGSVDEIKSVKIILDETKRIIKKEHKVDIVLNVNVRNKIQSISIGRYDFYVKGLSKKEFVDDVSIRTRETKKKLGALCNVVLDENIINEVSPKLEHGVVLRIIK